MTKKKNILDLLFDIKETPIRLVGENVNTVSTLRGITSALRPSSANGNPKFSTIGLLLDKIILDKNIVAYESDDSIYVSFDKYKATFDGEQVIWMSEEIPNNYELLLPILIYFISMVSNANSKYTQIGKEIKQYFSSIQEKNTKEQNYGNVVCLCDAFYYGYAAKEKELIYTQSVEILGSIMRGIKETNRFSLIDGFNDFEFDSEKAEEIREVEKTDFTVDYNWTEDQRKNIVSKEILDTFVKTDISLSLIKKIKYRMDKVQKRLNEGKTGLEAIGSDYINLLLVGRPATGKTALANYISGITGMPIYTVPFSRHTEEDVAEGKNKIISGQIDFVETDFLKAYQNGGIIVCEEINLADPAVVMGVLGQAIEKPFVLMRDGYQTVRRHPMCIIIATMNVGTAGSRSLNQALSSRFKNTYILDDPDRRTFIEILTKAGYEKRHCTYVYDAYMRINSYLKSPEQSQEELCENLTLRGCFGALECMEEGENAKDAIKHSLIGKIAEVDLETAKRVQENVVDVLPDFKG